MKSKNVIEIFGNDLSCCHSCTPIVSVRTLLPPAKNRQRTTKVGPFFGPHRDNCG